MEGKLFVKIPDLFPGFSALLAVVPLLVVALLVVGLTLSIVGMVQFHRNLEILEMQSQVLGQEAEEPLGRRGHFPGHQEESWQLSHQGQPEVLQHEKKKNNQTQS